MRTSRSTDGRTSQKDVLVVCAPSRLLLFAFPGARPVPPGATPRRALTSPDIPTVDFPASTVTSLRRKLAWLNVVVFMTRLLHDGLQAGLEGLECGLGVGPACDDRLRELGECLAAVED